MTTRIIFSDMVEDERAVNPYEELEDKTVTGMLQDMVKHLDAREATILRFRFGPRRRHRENFGGSRRKIPMASPANASGRSKTWRCANCAR